AIITDPTTYTIDFDPNFTPELVYSITFTHGMAITMGNFPGAIAGSASLNGSAFTSLLPNPLWTYSWSQSLGAPLPTFTFQSDPTLGLNDESIMNAFNNSLTTAGGTTTLTSDLNIEASLFPQVPA